MSGYLDVCGAAPWESTPTQTNPEFTAWQSCVQLWTHNNAIDEAQGKDLLPNAPCRAGPAG